MGKPWKKREKVVSDAPLDYKWSSQSYSLKDILANFKLPVVVQCREDTSAEHVQNFFFDLRQPILLHSRRTIRKVFARCIRKGEGGTVKELLPEVVVPEDYAGWFKISKGLNFTKPSPHKTIDSLTRANSEFFLCTTEFRALVLTGGDADHDDDEPAVTRPVPEGEVLRKTGVQKLNIPSRHTSDDSQSALDNRYLMCIDDKDCELYIPITQTGLFYEVSDGNFSKQDNSIVQISDILDELVELPIYVRHILGDPPPISKFYSPCLKLCRYKEEESVMGSTLDAGEESLPLELQTHSPVKFEIALNTPMLNSCLEYLEAVEMCNSVSPNYVTDMKLAVTFKLAAEEEQNNVNNANAAHSNQAFVPDENETASSICNSQRTSVMSGSELGEVDAKSEFSIQWEPSAAAFEGKSECSDRVTDSNDDCISIESLDLESVQQFHEDSFHDHVNLQNSFAMWQNRLNAASKSPTDEQTNANRLIVGPTSDIEVTPFVDIVEGITDFSVRQDAIGKHKVMNGDYEHCHEMLAAPSPFQNESGVKINPLALAKAEVTSSTSTISGGSDIDLSDYYPSMNSSSNESLQQTRGQEKQKPFKVDTGHYSFTGDVYINHSESEEETKEETGAIAKHWADMYKVVRRKEQKVGGGEMRSDFYKQKNETKQASPYSGDLIQFDDDASDVNSGMSSGILTCKVADEMVSSYNDLRLSLEEVTRNARDSHTETSWRDFCLERSSSLPVRSRAPNERGLVHTEDQSQSWEQISPRRSDTSTPRTKSSRSDNKRCHNLNESYDVSSNGEKAQLILDTSSEDGGTYSLSQRYENDSANNSFTLSDTSDMSVTDGQLEFLAAVGEMDACLDEIDDSVMRASTLTKDRSLLAQRMKIKREIKRKKVAEWNDEVSVI